MVKADLLCGSSTASITFIEYLPIGNGSGVSSLVDEADRETRWRTAGTFSNLGGHVISNTNNGTTVMTFRKNSVNGNGTISIGASATGHFEDISNTDTVAAGDDVTFEIDGTAGSSGNQSCFNKVSFEPTSGEDYSQKTMIAMQNVSTNLFAHLYGSINNSENNSQFKSKIVGTMDNLYVLVSDNANTGTTTFVTRKNDGDGNLTVSVTTTATGLFEDTTNSDSFVVDDELALEIDPAGTGNITSYGGMDIVSTNYSQYSTRGNTVGDGVTSYRSLAATQHSDETVRQRFVNKQNFDLMETKITANSLNVTWTLVSRVDLADGNMTVSVTAAATGDFQDITNTDDVADNAGFNYKDSSPSGSGTISLATITVRTNQLQFARPDGDSAIGSWTDDGGGTTDIYQSIDEAQEADDSDFIHSEANPASNSIYVATLSNVTDPEVSHSHIVRYRYQKNDANQTINLIVRLKQGASTTIASNTHNGITTTWTDGEFTLSGAETDNITDYDDLRIEVEADVP